LYQSSKLSAVAEVGGGGEEEKGVVVGVGVYDLVVESVELVKKRVNAVLGCGGDSSNHHHYYSHQCLLLVLLLLLQLVVHDMESINSMKT